MEKLSEDASVKWLEDRGILRDPYSGKVAPQVTCELKSFGGIGQELLKFSWSSALFKLNDYFAASDVERNQYTHLVGAWYENLLFNKEELNDLVDLATLVSRFPNGWSFYIYTESMTFYFWDGEFVDIWVKS
jgi:hypothetical protein